MPNVETKLRCAFTIHYNGLHHLQHGDFAQRMLSFFDHWIVVDGHALPGGTTSWCNHLKYQPVSSTDGSLAYLKSLPGVHLVTKKGYWASKDDMVKAAINRLKTITDQCTLWQVDTDEWWRKEQLLANEKSLKGKVGAVGFHHIVGEIGDDLLVVRGQWGNDYVNRLWRWSGEQFLSHEPAVLEGQGVVEKLPEKFLHFSYYFEKDVEFKAKYYKNHGDIYKSWKELQKFKPEQFPCHIYRAFGRKSPIGRTNTRVYRLPKEAWMLSNRPGNGHSKDLRAGREALVG